MAYTGRQVHLDTTGAALLWQVALDPAMAHTTTQGVGVAPETVELPHDQHLILATGPHRGRQDGTRDPSAGGLLRVDVDAARRA